MKTINKIHLCICITFLLLLSINSFAQYGIEIGSGGNITLTGAATIDISNGNLVNNGTYTKGSETVTMSGNTAKTISGTSNTSMNDLVISNTGGITTQLGLLTASNLTISSSCVFTIDAVKAVTVSGTLTNNTPGNTGLVLKSTSSGTGSLITTSSVAGTAERFITNNQDWHFLSSPVASQPIWPQFAPTPTGSPLSFGVAPWNWDFYYWNPNANMATDLCWVNLRKNTSGDYNDGVVDENSNVAGYGSAIPNFTVGRGYLTAYNAGWFTGSPDTHLFSGTLNTGEVTKVITCLASNLFNLVGNPYQSAINWDLADGSTSWGRSGALDNTSGYDYWLWDDAGSGNYLYRNTSGTGTAGQYIAPGQGFFVKSDANGGTLYFRQDIKAHSSQAWVKETSATNNALRLKLTSSANTYFDEMFVAFNPEYSGLEGTAKFWSFYTEAPEIYSAKGGINYSINRYKELSHELTVPIAAKTGVSATYTINATNIFEFELSNKVILEDLLTGTTQDLKINPSYSFSAIAGDNPDRFNLHFGGSYGIDSQVRQTDLSVYTFNKKVYIHTVSGRSLDGNVYIHNILGQEVVQERIIGNNTIINLNQPPGCYLVSVVNSNQTCTKKVFIR